MSVPTASQTVGPFFSIGMDWPDAADLAGAQAGDAILIRGRVLDGEGRPVSDAVLELWQADPDGRYAHPTRDGGGAGFVGSGRSAVDPQGRFAFRTLRPGRVVGPGGVLQAPHLSLTVFARGLQRQLQTRVYLPDEASNQTDPILLLVPEARRATLVASPDGQGAYRFDVVLQGAGETVFLEF